MPNMKPLSLTVQKLWRKLKLTKTDRTKTICPRSFDPWHKKQNNTYKLSMIGSSDMLATL